SKRHSNTFGGGTLASAVALRSLEILVAERLDLRARELGVRGLARMLAVAERYPDLVEEARGAGMLFAFKLRPLLGFKVPGIPDPLFTELWDRVEAFAAANPRTLRLLQ